MNALRHIHRGVADSKETQNHLVQHMIYLNDVDYRQTDYVVIVVFMSPSVYKQQSFPTRTQTSVETSSLQISLTLVTT